MLFYLIIVFLILQPTVSIATRCDDAQKNNNEFFNRASRIDQKPFFHNCITYLPRDVFLDRDLCVGRHLCVRGVSAIKELRVEKEATFLGNVLFAQGVPGHIKNILLVTKGTITAPHMFNSIKQAVDSITDNSPTNRYIIDVGPGVFIEDTITLKPYVSVIGRSVNEKYYSSF